MTVVPVGVRAPDIRESDPGRCSSLLSARLVIFAEIHHVRLPRLRNNTDIAVAPLLAASIFLDVLNVFLFFLEIFLRGAVTGALAGPAA